jgi:hypothetical protein
MGNNAQAADFVPRIGFDLSAVIASGQTKSGVIDLSGCVLVGILTPAALTGTSFSFEASTAADGTFLPVYDISGNPVSVDVGTSRFIAILPSDLAGIQYLKLVSGSSEGAQRIIGLSCRGGL